MSYHPKRPKSLITKHAIFPPNINPSSKTPELHTRLFIPGSLLNKKFENKEIRPLTAKIVNISRITHMKEPPPKKEDFFLLPRYMEVQPRNYPKLKKRPHSFNSKASEPVDQSKIIANSIKISNNRYNDQESSTKERKHSFCIKKAKPHKPTLTKEAENSLNKTLGKNPELPYLPETSSINPYDTFQKLLNKSKQVSHAKNSSSLIKETKIFDFSISINQDKSLIPSKLKLKEEFQKNQEEDNEFLSIKEKTSFLDKTKEPELSLLDDSEKAFVKIRSIEEFLEMIKNKEVHPLEFIYLFKPKQAEAYDLKVVSYLTITRLKAKQYFTLSSKGITFFEKGLPKEFIFLGDWLRERDQYLALKSLSFFRKFRKWKSLKKWQKLLQIRRNKHVAKVLSENLFQIHSIYQKILLKHRSFTANIEAMRLMDFSSFLEVKSLEDFATIQEKKRRLIFEYLQILSEQMHENCSLGLQTLMDRIRSHVRNELSEEDEQSGLINKSINAINFQGKKIAKPENKRGLIEILNLPENLNYQHRSLVRSECLKILRFTYLLDFLTLESLSNVYISSLKDFLQKVVKMKGSDLKTRDFMKKRSQELDPLLLIKAKFIPAFLEKKELVIEEVEIDGFDIASHIEDFDLELYAEFKDPPFISDNEEDNLPKNKTIISQKTYKSNIYSLSKKIANPTIPNPNDSFLKTKRQAKNLQKIWLEFLPKKRQFFQFLTQNFTEGLQILQSVKKWSKSQEFLVYANSLEDWDQILGDSWVYLPEKQYLDPSSWLKLGKYSNCELLMQEIMLSFEQNLKRIEDFRAGFWPFLDLYWRVKNTDYYGVLSNETLSHPHEIFILCMDFLNYGVEICEEQLKEGVDIGLFHIDCEGISIEIKKFFNEINGSIHNIILEVFRIKMMKLRRFLLSSLKKISGIILKIEDFIEQKEHIDRILQNLPCFRIHKENLELIYQVLIDQKLILTKEDKDIYIDIPRFETQLSNRIQELEASSSKTIERFQVKLSETYIRFRSEAIELETDLSDPLFLEFTEEIEEILRKLRGLKLKVDTLNGSVDKYQDFATRLQIKGFEELKELEIVKREIEVKLLLWESLGDWTGLIENWTKTSFVNLDTEIIGEQSEKYLKIALHCEKNLAQNEVIKRFKGDLEKFRELLPVITALKSTFLKTGHWNELYSLIFLEKGYSPSGRRRISKRRSLWEESEEKIVKSQNKEGFKEDDLQGVILGGEFTLNNLIHLNLLLYKEEIMEISMKAQQEHSLERNLELLERNFEEKALNFKPWDLNSDILILFETDELFQALNETISSINSILSTRYSGFLKKKAELLQKNVLLFEDLMEKWLETQGKWLYFSRIFAMSEVRRDLTLHVSSFDINDKTLKHLMRRLTLNPTVSKLLKISGLNEQFLKLLESFTKLERELEVYLDGKRTLFARLYFLSNEELLDLLSKTKNLVKIQPFLLKLFDNIHTITIVEDLSIKLVISQEGEVLELKKLVFLKGPLENWLEGLQNSMQETLKKMFRKALQEFNSNNLSKLDFINQEIGQISVLTLSLNWTLMVEGVLIEHNPNGLEEIYDISIVHLEKLIKHLKNNENPLFRSKLRNQLILDLHTRDLLQKLLLENVNDINDFNWQQTLRVYQDLDSNEVILIKQLSFCFPYCFEYQGVRPRLVITPLTSRCFLTVSTAFTEGLGVSLWGPAGTGKTETMKELAKFCGVFCLVFNCSEQVSQKTLSQLLIGLVAQGVWGCLDEFNRLGLEVLALVSQQLLIIRMGLAQQQSEIDFDGKMISFKRKTYGFSITMNPGYQGRRELPENLKGLLRPIFMMVPNFEIITEVLLVGMGFHKAKELAISIVRLYKLCEEQLSRQIHYDFGLRALKSMLVWLEGNKNNWEGGIEEIIVIESVKTNNIGKLIKEDLILFNQLISDVFPEFVCKNIENNDNNRNNDIKNNELSNIDNINLIQASKSNPNQSILITPQISLLIKASFEELSFQFTQQLLSKILYLHQTIPLRFGVILLGSPKTAKSTCLKILSHYMNIHPLSLNPKSMALNELFGSMTSNGEWKEGLASFLLKEANVRPEPSWLLFDGPVDSSWIENLNSVLDDNRTLCLANSERIRLKDSMRLFFECEDLHSASPATISRCGVAFFPECQDLWQLILETWVTGLQDYKSEESQERSISQDIGLMVKELGKKVLKEGFVALESYGEKNVAIRSIKSVCNVFEVILNREEVELDEAKDELKRKLNYIWAYAFIWGACAMYDLPNNKLENLLRETFKNLLFPFSESIFNLTLDPYTYSSFTLTSQAFDYPPSLSKNHSFLIPSPEFLPYLFILKSLLSYHKAVLLFGAPSSCKTSLIMQFFEAFPLESEDGFEPFTFPLLKSCPPHNLQAFIEKSCYKKSKNLYGSKLGKTTLFFIDDLNLSATKDNIHSGLTLELLRQILEYSGFYDPHKFFWKSLENISFIASLSQNSQSFHKGLSRLCRNFNCIYMGSPKQEFLQRLFEGYLNEYFLTGGGFAKEVKELCNGIISGTLEVFRRVKEFLKPIPRKFYYNFSMKDIKAVFQGLLLAKNNTLIMSSREEFIHLWIHEVYRVFYDGLNEESDRIWLKENVKMITSHILQYSGSNNEPDGFFFSEILRLDQQNSIYEEMKDFNKIKKVLEEKLINDPFWKIDSFIMSPEVIRYILRLLRILKASSSQRNILNLGLIGSGKKTLCKIAAFLKNMLVWEFNTTSPETFQEDLKHYLIKAALTQKPFILIFTDNAFDFEEIVYKIAILMNPLTPISELFENYEEILTEAAKSSKDKEISLCLEFKKRSHVMLCVSSESPALQKALREYELSRFCSGTIYYSPWGTEALLHVAQGLIPFESSGLKNLTVEIYQIVENEALNQTNYKPKVYLSPKSYVEMVMLFKELLEKNERIIKKKIKTLNNGLNKLASSQTLVSTLNKNLLALEPQLLLQSEKTEEIYKKLALEHAQANEKEMLIIQETAAMNIEMDRFQNLSLEAQNELEKAYPLLKEAQTALSALNKSDISEIRTFNNPPPIVAMVLEAVCLLLEEKTDWGSIKAVMTDIDFLGRLMALDTEKMKDSTIKKLKVLINKPEFEPESIGHKSLACKSLAMWCRAIENYYRIERIVRPKRIKTQELNKLLSDKKHLLDSKASELSLARSKLSELQFECDSNLSLRQEVMKEIELTSIRLSNSEKLNLLLYSEENKWQSLLQKLELDLSTIVGDTLLLSACLSFFGPFKPIIREKLLENWEDRFVFHDIKTKSDFLMSKMMFSDTQIRNWILLGLPNDERAIENGVLILGNRKPCVIIDPEGVGLSWLKASGMKILTMNAINKLFLAKILALGEGLIIDNFSEPLEEITQIILERKLMLIDGVKKIMLPEGLVNFNENFTLFLTTKQQDFELSSALFLKTNVVSFQVTYEGLVDQLLADVIWLEKPDLEASYKQINETMNRDKEDLAVREEKILILLDRPSELNILDDHELLSTLEISKKQTEEIERSLAESLQVEKKVLATRRLYKDIASLGASLYFTIKGLVHLEPIYYYSLESFKRSYKLAFKLKVFKNESDLERRSKALTKEIIRILYEKVSLGVFHEHKQILGFIMLMDLNRRKGLIPETLWELFLKGKIISSQMKIEGVNSFNNDNNNKRPSFVREDYWAEMLKFAKILKIEAYLLFMRSFTEKANEWKKFLDYPHEVSSIIPIPALELSDFVQLSSSFSLKNSTKNDILQILIKSFFLKNFKPNALPSFITIWLTPHLLLPSQTPDLDKVLCNIDRFTPLLLLLAPGTDPTDHLLRLSKEKHKGLNFASLNPVAFKKSLEKARDNGSWLIVQNCHLFSNFLKIIESEEKEVHQDFRLIMTTDPKTNFPIELLAKSFKFAFEKQQNFKSAMIEGYQSISPEEFEAFESKKSLSDEWSRIIFNLSIFHALVRTRGNFGGLGFTRPYEFNRADFKISKNLIKRGLLSGCDLEEMSDSLGFLIGNIYYGGRVLEDLDLMVIMALLKKYLNTEDHLKEFKENSMSFSYSGLKELIDGMAESDNPELYGLSENTVMILRTSQTKRMLEDMNKGQGIMGFEEIKSKEQVVLALIEDIQKSLPQSLENPAFLNKKQENSAIFLCLLQEIETCSKLLSQVNRTCEQIRAIIDGKEQNTQNLQEAFTFLYNNTVPIIWKEEYMFVSMKGLGGWIKTLVKRVAFLKEWMNDLGIQGIWLGGLSNQKRLFTSVLQDYSRGMKIPLGELDFKYKVEEFHYESFEKIGQNNKHLKENGAIFIYGLFLENAIWDSKKEILNQQKIGQLIFEMPVIQVIPQEINEDNDVHEEKYFACPLLKTNKGLMEINQNFIGYINLKIKSQASEFWILRGADLICQKED